MDTTSAKTWVDLGFHIWDSIKDQLIPALVGVIVGWVAPTPKTMIQRMRKK
jgi:hypothetical protein